MEWLGTMFSICLFDRREEWPTRWLKEMRGLKSEVFGLIWLPNLHGRGGKRPAMLLDVDPPFGLVKDSTSMVIACARTHTQSALWVHLPLLSAP